MKNTLSHAAHAALVLGLAGAGSARAALINVTYVGPSGGAWATPSNWSPVGVPNNGANTYNVLIDGTAADLMVNLTGTQTISGLTVDAGDGIAIANTARLRLRNDGSASFTNNGIIAIGSSGGDTYLQPLEGPVTLLGNGELTLTDSPTNWIYRGDTNGFLINDASHTIRGAGNLGWSGVPTVFTNDGTVLAEGVNPLIVDCSAGVTNNGLMQASTGTLRFQGNGTLDNSTGVIEALNGQAVELGNSVTVAGGELTSAGTGVIRSISANPTLSGSTSTLINNAAIEIPNSFRLRLSGEVENNGSIALLSATGDTYLHPLDGPVTLSGDGELTLSDSPDNWIYRGDSTGALVNGASHTIRGAGNIGWSGVPTTFTNDGTVLAEGAINPLIVDTSAGVTNTGLMQASTGTLRIQGNGTLDNSAGVIEALNGQVVELGNSVTVAGGELTSAGTGVIRSISANPTLSGSTSTLINNAAIEIPNSFRLRLSGEVENNGSIALQDSGSDTYLHPLDGPVTLSGDGELTLTDSANNWIYRGNSTGALVNGPAHTIRGAGNIGWSGTPTAFTNQGTVIADSTTNSLRIDCSHASGVTNQGLIQVTGAAPLIINGANFTNQGNVIIDATRSLTRSNGAYNQTAGTTNVAGAFTLQSATLALNGGVVKGTGNIAGTTTNSGGAVEPGASVGNLTMTTYTQNAGGRLRIEVADGAKGHHDKLVVSGTATLAGTLEIVPVSGYTPTPGDSFTILTAGTRTGTFQAVTDGYCVTYDATSAAVSVVDTCAADLAGCDANVNVDDLVAVILGWGPCPTACPPGCAADANDDCNVDVDDLVAVILGWGSCQ